MVGSFYVFAMMNVEVCWLYNLLMMVLEALGVPFWDSLVACWIELVSSEALYDSLVLFPPMFSVCCQ